MADSYLPSAIGYSLSAICHLPFPLATQEGISAASDYRLPPMGDSLEV